MDRCDKVPASVRLAIAALSALVVLSACYRQGGAGSEPTHFDAARALLSDGGGGVLADLASTRSPSDAGGVYDAALDASAGGICRANEVCHQSDCTPMRIQGCAAPCSASDRSSCPAGYRCDRCGARSQCGGSDCRPGCVRDDLALTFAPGELYLRRTHVVRGQMAEVAVWGGNFDAAGGLPLLMRVDSGSWEFVDFAIGCQLADRRTFASAGVFAVEIAPGDAVDPSLYTPSLAGFLTVMSSDGPWQDRLAQPGEACNSSRPCLEAPPYRCGCNAGRCACARR